MTITWTRHALDRTKEMGLTKEDVENCIRNPEQSYTQSDYRSNSRVFQCGKIAAVVRDNQFIITVLWRTEEVYLRKK